MRARLDLALEAHAVNIASNRERVDHEFKRADLLSESRLGDSSLCDKSLKIWHCPQASVCSRSRSRAALSITP